jgi:hypothetical protein
MDINQKRLLVEMTDRQRVFIMDEEQMNLGKGPDILHKQGKQPENMIPHNRDWHHPKMKRSA